MKRRLLFQSLLEIILPVMIMLAFVGIRGAVKVEDEVFSTRLENSVFFDRQASGLSDGYKASVNHMIRAGGFVGKIAFVPAGPQMDRLLNQWAKFNEPFPFRYERRSTSEYTLNATYTLANFTVASWSSEADLISYVESSSYGVGSNPQLVAAVIIEQFGDSSNNFQWRYKLRGNASRDSSKETSLATNDIKAVNELQWIFEKTNWRNLALKSHLFLQIFVESFILQQAITAPYNAELPDHSITLAPFPTPAYRFDPFADLVSDFLGLIFTVIFLWPVTRVVKLLVEEKEQKIKEGMKIMGLSESALFFSWLLTYAIVFFIMSLIILFATGSTIFKYSGSGRVFIFFWFFGMATFAFGFLVSTMFSKARTASTMAAIVYLVLYFPYYAVAGTKGSTGTKTAACLSAPVCFGLGASTMIKFEAAGTGVNNGNAGTNIDGFSYDSTIGMLVLDFIIYILLGLYFNEVLPSEWGTHRPWYFLCTKSFYFPEKLDSNSENAVLSKHDYANPQQRDEIELQERGAQASALSGVFGSNIEPVSADVAARAGVKIRHLRKQFGSTIEGDEIKLAVKDLSFDFYEGEITCLLGHNGAGKSTAINMLTGMLPVSKGDALVFGHSIRTAMPAIRGSLGVCPQHSILFDILTVREHLELYAAIKGVPSKEVGPQLKELVEELGLKEKIDDYSASLSGGMKRKLSVAIALIGFSKFIVLDEPSTGCDSYSRRLIWDLLKRRREKSVILLTTHFMDEAEQLGDRIAIMADGDIKCCGSSLFLKNHYGVGYTLTVVKKTQGANENSLIAAVERRAPNYEILTNIAGEISFRLPTSASATFPDLFQEFDENLPAWGISSYGISVTTLEEVFLRVGTEAEQEMENQKERKKAERKEEEGAELTPSKVLVQPAGTGSATGRTSVSQGGENAGATGNPHEVRVSPVVQEELSSILQAPTDLDNLPIKHIRALYIKRFQDARRNKRGWCFTIIIPFIVMVIGLAVVKILTGNNQEMVRLNALQYNQPYAIPTNTLTPLSAAILPVSTSFSSTKDGVYSFSSFPQCTNASSCGQFLYDNYQAPAKAGRSWFGAVVSDLSESGTQLVDKSTFLFNTSATYSIPVHVNLHHQRILQYYSGVSQASIDAALQPFPLTANQKILTNSIAAVFIGIAFAFIPAHFIHYSVHESEVKSKHQQFISGVSAFSYWFANYLWDFTNYMVPGLLCLLCLAMFDIKETIGANAGATFVLILLYGLSIISFSYMASFVFKSHTSAQNVMLILFVLVGAFLLVASILLDIIESTKSINSKLKFLYRLFPSFCFGEGLANLIVRESVTAFGGSKGIFDMEITGYPCIFMTWEMFAYFIIVLIIEHVMATPELFKYFVPAKARNSRDDPNDPENIEDEDVRAERDRVDALVAGSSGQEEGRHVTGLDYVTIHQLRKVYANFIDEKIKTAVHNLSVGIQQGECFGLLGINGAGKTTSLKVLTNDLFPTSGSAWFNGIDLMRHQSDVRQLIGYCPQFDALISTLTAREHLILFARIKGIKEAAIPDMVEKLIHRLGLQAGIADRPVSTYSGGNLRKTCLGIALVGNGGVLLLDEISSGVDAGSRRALWSLIAAAAKTRAVILTTHSMEEAEALCGRIGIMVGGRFKCLGTAQHLRSKYGQGYQLDVNLSHSHGNSEALAINAGHFKEWVKRTWPKSTEIEIHDSNMKFRIDKLQPGNAAAHALAIGDGPLGGVELEGIFQSAAAGPGGDTEALVSIGRMFKILERIRGLFDVREYSISETTLDQIFLHFAATDKEYQAGAYKVQVQ